MRVDLDNWHVHQTVPPVHHQTLGGLAGEHRALGPGQHVNMLFFFYSLFSLHCKSANLYDLPWLLHYPHLLVPPLQLEWIHPV